MHMGMEDALSSAYLMDHMRFASARTDGSSMVPNAKVSLIAHIILKGMQCTSTDLKKKAADLFCLKLIIK